MSVLLRLAPTMLALLAAAGPARALEWKDTAREARAAPFAETVDLVYEFRNAGSRPVTVADVQTSCHCISAAPDKRVYQPGETGRITAHFVVADRFGLYERTISVASDDAPEPMQLTARIEVPDIAVVAPRSLEWRLGAPADEQVVDVRAAGDLRIDFATATPTNGAFTVRLEPIESGRLYRLHIRPASTAAVANAAIRVQGRERTGHDVLVSAYANVR